MSESEKKWVSVVGEEGIEIPVILPVLPVRDAVVFPGMNVRLMIGRTASLAALEQAGEGGFLVVATQKDPTTENPGLEGVRFPVTTTFKDWREVEGLRMPTTTIIETEQNGRMIMTGVDIEKDVTVEDDFFILTR